MKTMAAIVVSLAFLTGCPPPVAEGERCDPALSHDECDNAPTVQCVIPTNCLESYCCSTTSTQANCQACPAPDAGTD